MKIEHKTLIDRRFGFPVRLENVPVKQMRGHEVVDVDANALRHAVLVALLRKPTRLTGSEVRFIRLELELSKAAFAARCGVTHPAVIKWEGCEGEVTHMASSTEFLIRFMILELLPSLYRTQQIPESLEPTKLREVMTASGEGPAGVTINEARLRP